MTYEKQNSLFALFYQTIQCFHKKVPFEISFVDRTKI